MRAKEHSMTFGEKLTAARKEKNLSQEELAKSLYVTRQAISRWENNSTQPSLEMLADICRVLEKTPNDLIDTEREKSFRFYKSLTFREKYSLALEWNGEHKSICFFMVFFNFIVDLGIGLIIYFAISQSYQSASPFFLAFCLSGAVLLVAAGILLCVMTFINNTIKYNTWLLQKKSIIRKRRALNDG